MVVEVVLVILGFLPTFGAWVAEGTQNRLLTRCVGAMNLCGVLPFALELWLGGGQLPKLSGYLADPFIWGAMEGAAATSRLESRLGRVGRHFGGRADSGGGSWA